MELEQAGENAGYFFLRKLQIAECFTFCSSFSVRGVFKLLQSSRKRIVCCKSGTVCPKKVIELTVVKLIEEAGLYNPYSDISGFRKSESQVSKCVVKCEFKGLCFFFRETHFSRKR